VCELDDHSRVAERRPLFPGQSLLLRLRLPILDWLLLFLLLLLMRWVLLLVFRLLRVYAADTVSCLRLGCWTRTVVHLSFRFECWRPCLVGA